MNEFVIAIDPPEAVALEIEAGRIVNVPSPPEVYVPYIGVSTHSRPKAAGMMLISPRRKSRFQLTAARRRLGEPD